MASNPTPAPALLIVKNLDDDASLCIQSRMGMTVTEFMKRLREPQTKPYPGSEVSSNNFIWPKHTDYEICDPTSAVYQRDSNDCSWSLRFRALGCYLPPPIRAAEPAEHPTGPRTPPLFPNNQTVEEPTAKPLTYPKPSVNGEQWKTLLKSRSSINSFRRLSSENITAEQHLQLEEDLQLSDSEEEPEQTDLRTSADKLPSRPGSRHHHVVNTTQLQTFHSAESPRSVGNQVCGNLSRPVPVEHLINECSEIPPPFVSPLSTMGDDAFDCEPADIATHFENEVVIQSDSTDRKEQMLLDRPAEKSGCSDFRSFSNLPSMTEPDVFRRLKVNVASPETEHEVSNELSNENLTDRSDQDSLIPSPVTHHDQQAQINGVKPPAFEQNELKPFNSVDIHRDYVKRLLAESTAVLTAKHHCLVTGLSPVSEAVSWKTSVFSPDKENTLVPKPALTTHSPSRTRKDRVCTSSTQSYSQIAHPLKSASTRRKQPRGASVDEQLTDPLNRFFKSPGIKPDDSLVQDGKTLSSLPSLTKHSVCPPATEHTEQQPMDEGPDNKSQAFCVFPTNKKSNTPDNQVHPPQPSADSSISLRTELPNTSNSSDSLKFEERKSECISIVKRTEIDPMVDCRHPTPNSTANTTASDRVFMPPPDSATAKSKRPNLHPVEAKEDDTSDVVNETKSVDTCSATSETISPGGLDKQQTKSAPGATTLRAFPDKRWLFSDVALAKVRTKVQNVIQRFNTNKAHNRQDLLENIRATLAAFVASGANRDQPNAEGRKSRPRPLMGVLLVPVSIDGPLLPQRTEAVALPQSVPLEQPSRLDGWSMTSPSLASTATFTTVGVQCVSPSLRHVSPTLLPSPPLDTVSDTRESQSATGQLPQCVNCHDISRKSHVSSPSATASIVNSKFLEAQDLLLAAEEENRVHDTTVDQQLHLAGECNSEASQCWKSLVSVISDTQSVTPNNDLYHLLLRLDSLHRYPVQLIRVVRHFICAAHLLERSGDFERATKILAEASGQIDHINRRMRRVEMKLIKRRIRPQKHTDHQSAGTGDPSARARRDAGWMHLWYYVLSRIRSILSFREYRLRMQLAGTLHNEVEEEMCALQLPAEDSRIQSNKPISATSMNMSVETLQRLRRLIQLQGMVRQATVDWEEAEKLAAEVPPWLSDTRRPDEFARLTEKIDGDIARTVGGAHLSGWQTRTGTLLRFIDGIVKVHEIILKQLKSTLSEAASPSSDHVNRPVSSSEIGTVKPPPVDKKQSEVDILPKNEKSTGNSSLSTQVKSQKSRSKRKPAVQPVKSVPGEVCGSVSLDPDEVVKTSSPPVHIQKNGLNGQENPEPKEKKVRKRQLVMSDDHRLWDNNNPPVMSFTPSTATNTDVDSESVASSMNNEPNSLPDRGAKLSVKQKKPHNMRVPSKRNFQLKENEDIKHVHRNICSAESHPSTKVKPREVSEVQQSSFKQSIKPLDPSEGCVTSTPTKNGMHPSDTFSPEYPPSSPSPPVNRRRSKSLAPTYTTTRSSSPVDLQGKQERTKRKKACLYPASDNNDDNSEDNAYQPKRVRAAVPKSSQNDFSDSESNKSSSPPPPSYRPSVPEASLSVPRDRRSASVGRNLSARNSGSNIRSASSTMSASQNSTSDSMGYSPTKQTMVNGAAETREKPGPAEIVPVYRVSRIVSSPQNSTMNSVRQSSDPSSSTVLSVRRSFTLNDADGTFSKDKFPSFYARWKNEPLCQSNSVAKSKSQHVHR
ncbi:hypothetical protein CRM22_007364 [Opisthorchis felineus]|uniref:Uncharacterized protein n=1 Tax=Opisthorchis felineus TaxID=147828 RepID=A0A4S2LIF0_OPIFE|nr:hypothetical protein CRM22_007364 [Opisthorchis felineus]